MILGDYSGEVHLFPFRTEKLSPPAQMVLQLNVGEYVVAIFKISPNSLLNWGFFIWNYYCNLNIIKYFLCIYFKYAKYLKKCVVLQTNKKYKQNEYCSGKY